MKRYLSLFLAALFCLTMLAACGNDAPAPDPAPADEGTELDANEPQDEAQPEIELPETVRVSALNGPTAMGMVHLMQEAEDGNTALNYQFSLGTTDEMVPLISRGEIDIAALPANLASVLYNNTDGRIQVLAINTLGMLYVVEKGESIQSVADLAGQTILATGKGSTPEFAINYVLSQNGIDPDQDVTIEYKSEAAEILPFLMQGADGIAIIPQPFVTNAVNRVEGLRIALDWTEEWDNVAADGGGLVTGVVVVQREFAEQYPEAVALFLAEYAASTNFANSEVAAAAQLVEQYGIVDAEIAEIALPYCNITCITGTEMRERLVGYLTVLFEQNEQSVGGALPDDAFYYIAE